MVADLSAYTYNYPSDYTLNSSPFSTNIVKSPVVKISSIYTDGRNLFNGCTNLVEATLNITALNSGSEYCL